MSDDDIKKNSEQNLNEQENSEQNLDEQFSNDEDWRLKYEESEKNYKILSEQVRIYIRNIRDQQSTIISYKDDIEKAKKNCVNDLIDLASKAFLIAHSYKSSAKDEDNQFVSLIGVFYKELKRVLQKYKILIKEFEPGDKYDPDCCENLGISDDENSKKQAEKFKEGHIVSIVSPAFMIDDDTLSQEHKCFRKAVVISK